MTSPPRLLDLGRSCSDTSERARPNAFVVFSGVVFRLRQEHSWTINPNGTRTRAFAATKHPGCVRLTSR